MANLLYKKGHIEELLKAKYLGKNNFEDRKPKVLIAGIGSQGGGESVLRFFDALNWNITVTDLKSSRELKKLVSKFNKKNVKWTLGSHKMSDFLTTDIIVKSPAIPLNSKYIKRAKKKRIPITNDADILLTIFPKEKIIGITGTKGKTTTALLTAHLLKAKYKVNVAGIPGFGLLDIFFQKTVPDWLVCEFSSFDLDLVTNSPKYALITSCFNDHLNRYNNINSYCMSKASIFKFQDSSGILFLPNNAKMKSLYKSKVKGKLNTYSDTPARELYSKVFAPHPSSISASFAIAKYMNISKSVLNKRLSSFKTPAGRREIILVTKQVLAINDTTATNPDSAIETLKVLNNKFKKERKIVLIAGGEDKNFRAGEINAFLDAILRHSDKAYLLKGSLTNKMLMRGKSINKKIFICSSMNEAVASAMRESAEKKVILLSPGSASFNMFKNEFDRGNRFSEEIKRICKKYSQK